jgi:filamentous hemagglutinin family protein
MLVGVPRVAFAAPTGGQVASGIAVISQTGIPGQVSTTISQGSAQASLNWQSFNIAKGETVNFVQPSANAVAVNRITDVQGSQILGQINANGQVWLINPNGVLFGRAAQVNVGALLDSTLDIRDADSSVTTFSGNSQSAIRNLGTIQTAPGGYIAFLGHQQGRDRRTGGNDDQQAGHGSGQARHSGIAAAPPPQKTTRTFEMSLPTTSRAFKNAAPLITAVPCWSS